MDLDKILARADKLLDEARALYEEARAASAVKGFVEAGFRLEEARIKYLVLQEIGDAARQKTAVDRLRTINQLSKLIHDGKVAIAGSAADAAPKPPDSTAKEPAPAVPAPAPAPDRPAPPEAAPADPLPGQARFTVPTAEKEQQAQKLVRDIFKDQYAKKLPADRQALARALLDQARVTQKDPIALWTYCREARDVAVQSGDTRSAMEAVDVLARSFDVDPLAMRNEALAALAKTVRTPAECSALVATIFALLEDLIAADQYDPAEKAAALALQTARRTNDVSLIARATSRSADVTDAKAKFQAMKSVLETLAKSPEDPAANDQMGQFLCFVKGSWELGLRFLAKGSEPTLQSLASREIALPSEALELAALAEAWADLGSKEKSPLRKSQAIGHARILYEAALPSATGLLRIKIEKKLIDLGGSTPGVKGELALLPMIDLKEDVVVGAWRFEGKNLLSPLDKPARIQFPYQPPEEYDLTVQITRLQKDGAPVIGLVSGDRQFNFAIDGWAGGEWTGLDLLDLKSPPENETGVHRKVLEVGKTTTVICSVRKDGVVCTVDGVKIVAWKGDFHRLSIWDGYKVNRNDVIFLGTYAGVFKFSKASIVEPSDRGRKIR